MERLSTQYETRSLMVGTLLCIPHGCWLSLLYFPLEDQWTHASYLCLYVNSAHAEKDIGWVRCYLPTPAETFGCMSSISSVRSAWQSEALYCDQCCATRKTTYARAEWFTFILILINIYTRQYISCFKASEFWIQVLGQGKQETKKMMCIHGGAYKWLVCRVHCSKGRRNERSEKMVTNRLVGNSLLQARLDRAEQFGFILQVPLL